MNPITNIDINEVKKILLEYGFSIEDDLIGKGSFTKVFSGKNIMKDQIVCIKIQKDEDNDGLESEMQNTSNLPCYLRIMKPIQFFKSQSYKFSVCKIGEQNLKVILKEMLITSKIDLNFAQKVSLDILLSLFTMNVEGVTHTDIKLENIIKFNGNFNLIDWTNNMNKQQLQYATYNYWSEIPFELDNMIEIFKSGVYLCGITIKQLCEQMENTPELECFKTINKQFLLVHNPYLRFSLIEVIDQLYSFFGEKKLQTLMEYERKRVGAIITKLKYQNKTQPTKLTVYFYYFSKLQISSEDQLKYLKKSIKYSSKEQLSKEGQELQLSKERQTLQVDRALIQIQLARFYLRNCNLQQAAIEVKQGFKTLESNEQFSFTVYFKLILCLGEILYENQNFIESKELIQRISNYVCTLYGNDHLLSIELKLLGTLAQIQISPLRDEFYYLKHLEKICEEQFFSHEIRAKVKLGISKYAEKERTHCQKDKIKEAKTIYQNLFFPDSIKMAEIDELKSDYFFIQQQYPKALQKAQSAYNKKDTNNQDEQNPQFPKSLKRIAMCLLKQQEINKAQIICKDELKIRKDEKIFEPKELSFCYDRYIKSINLNSNNNFNKQLTNEPIYQLVQEQQLIEELYNNFTINLKQIVDYALSLLQSQSILSKLEQVNEFQRNTDQKEFNISHFIKSPEGVFEKNIKQNIRVHYPNESKLKQNQQIDSNKDIHPNQNQFNNIYRHIQNKTYFSMGSYKLNIFVLLKTQIYNQNQKNY